MCRYKLVTAARLGILAVVAMTSAYLQVRVQKHRRLLTQLVYNMGWSWPVSSAVVNCSVTQQTSMCHSGTLDGVGCY